MPRRLALRCLLGVLLLIASLPTASAQERLLVFAAASMKNALDEANAAFTRRSGIVVSTSYAASSALMKQIEQGAPADVFISADVDWMQYGAERKLVRADTRVDLLGNRLVLVAPAAAGVASVEIRRGMDMLALARGGRLVTGDVRAVPVGRYAKAALESLGLWNAVAGHLAMAENVRAALALVARGEAALGIVYATDARAEPGVRVIGTFPDESHPPVVYPAAATATAKPQANAYLAFLRSDSARGIFVSHGFEFLSRPAR